MVVDGGGGFVVHQHVAFVVANHARRNHGEVDVARGPGELSEHPDCLLLVERLRVLVRSTR